MSPTYQTLKTRRNTDEDDTGNDAAFEGIPKEAIAIGDCAVGVIPIDKTPKPMNSPPEMTPAEWEKHKVAHEPPHPGCPHCRAGQWNNLPHKRSTTERALPHLVADYAYLRDSLSAVTLTVLVVYILPFRIFFATVVDQKGPTPPRGQKTEPASA